MNKLTEDRRLDPGIRAAFGDSDISEKPGNSDIDGESRAALIAEANSPEARAAMAQAEASMDAMDNEEYAPSTGLDISTQEFISSPDGNTIKVNLIRPQGESLLPCVYYLHGGGMQGGSCFSVMWRAWGKIIAQYGVAVAMVDFRNCLTPSSAPEIVPFPGGLNDCVSGVKWLHGAAEELGLNPDRIIVAGESGGAT